MALVASYTFVGAVAAIVIANGVIVIVPGTTSIG